MKLFKRKPKDILIGSVVLSCNDMLMHTLTGIKQCTYETYSSMLEISGIDAIRSFITDKAIYGFEKLGISNYNILGNIIIEFTFSDYYLAECAEFLAACNGSITKLKTLSKEGRLKFLKIKDKDGVKTKLGKSKDNINYLLLSTNPVGITNIFKNIESLSNTFLSELTYAIYNNIDYTVLSNLIDDGVLDIYRFSSYKEPLLIQRSTCTSNEDCGGLEIMDYDSPYHLSEAFSYDEITDMINVYYQDNNKDNKISIYSLYKLIELSLSCKTEYNAIVKLVDTSGIFQNRIIKSAKWLDEMSYAINPNYLKNKEDFDDKIYDYSEVVKPDAMKNTDYMYSPLIEEQKNLIDEIDLPLDEDDPEYFQLDVDLRNNNK